MTGYSNLNTNLLGNYSYSSGMSSLGNYSGYSGMSSFGCCSSGLCGFGTSGLLSSIWNPLTYNSNGTFNFEGMAGYNLANLFLNIGGGVASQAIQDSKANSQSTLTANVQSYQSQIDTKLNSLEGDDGATEKNYKEYGEASKLKKQDWYTEEYNKQQEIINSGKATDEIKKQSWYTTEKTKQDKIVADSEQTIKKLQADYDEAPSVIIDCETKINALDKNASDYSTQLKSLQDKKAAAEKVQTDYKAAEKANQDAKTALEELETKAVEKTKEAAEKAITTLDEQAATKAKNNEAKIEAIDNLIEQRDAVQAKLDNKVLDKADGTKWSRSKSTIAGKVEDDDWEINWKKTDFNESDIQEAVYQYSNASDKKTKLKWAKILTEMDGTLFTNLSNASQRKARELAENYLDKNG